MHPLFTLLFHIFRYFIFSSISFTNSRKLLHFRKRVFMSLPPWKTGRNLPTKKRGRHLSNDNCIVVNEGGHGGTPKSTETRYNIPSPLGWRREALSGWGRRKRRVGWEKALHRCFIHCRHHLLFLHRLQHLGYFFFIVFIKWTCKWWLVNGELLWLHQSQRWCCLGN